MTDFELRYSEKSVKEYIKMSFLGKNTLGMLPMILCGALLTAVPLIGLIGFIMTKNNVMLILMICTIVFDAAVIVAMNLMINKYTKKLVQALRRLDGLVCALSESDIILVRGNAPQSVIDWKDIEEINEGKTAFFLKTHEGLILDLEKDAVLSGTLDEAKEVIGKKYGEIEWNRQK